MNCDSQTTREHKTPESNKSVQRKTPESNKERSKIEYLIYRELQDARNAGKLTFAYEEERRLR